MMSTSIELDETLLGRLRKVTGKSRQTPETTAAQLLEEGLRAREFPGIHFRDTDTGHQAMVPGIRVPVYFLALLAREVDEDIQTIADHYGIPTTAVIVALDYIRAFPDEIEHDIVEHEAAEDHLLATLPADNIIVVP